MLLRYKMYDFQLNLYNIQLSLKKAKGIIGISSRLNRKDENMNTKLRQEFEIPKIQIIPIGAQDIITLSQEIDPNQGVWDMQKDSGL